MKIPTSSTMESTQVFAMPRGGATRELKRVAIVWARGACRQSLGLEILHDLLCTQGVRQAAFSCDARKLLLIDYDSENIDTIEILNTICRPGVWAKFLRG